MLDQDIVIHDQGTLTTAILETRPPETKRDNATNNTYEPTTTEKATTKEDVSEDRNGGSSDNNCKRGEFDLSTLGQRQLDETNPMFATTPLIPSKNNATKNKYGHKVPKNVITIYRSSEDEEEYKEDPVDVWALQQHRVDKKDPKFLSSSIVERKSMMDNGLWPPDGAYRQHESSTWPPTH